MRLVSLVPSLSHLLCDVGLKESVVGCTNFCVLPPDLARLATVVGGTKDPNIATIAALKPTHIIVNEEENKPEHIAACHAIAPTLVTFPKGPADVGGMLRDIGAFLGQDTLTTALQGQVAQELSYWTNAVRQKNAGKRFLYFIWREPYMVAGTDTYINRMLGLTGLSNAYQGEIRYPSLTLKDIGDLQPDLVFLASEPYPFRRRDALRLREEWPEAPPIQKIDGQLMSWYGSMTYEALVALRRWHSGEGETQLVKPLEDA